MSNPPKRPQEASESSKPTQTIKQNHISPFSKSNLRPCDHKGEEAESRSKPFIFRNSGLSQRNNRSQDISTKFKDPATRPKGQKPMGKAPDAYIALIKKRKVSAISTNDEENDASMDALSASFDDDRRIEAPPPKKPFKPAETESNKVVIDLTYEVNDEEDDGIEIVSDDEPAAPADITIDEARSFIKIVANYTEIIASYKKIQRAAAAPCAIVAHAESEVSRMRDVLMRQKPEFWDQMKIDVDANVESAALPGGEPPAEMTLDAVASNEDSKQANDEVAKRILSYEQRLEEAEKENERFRAELEKKQLELDQRALEDSSRIRVAYPSTWTQTRDSTSFDAYSGMVDVSPQSDEHGAISACLFNTITGRSTTVEVMSIKRNQNPYIWNKYFANHVHIYNKNGAISNEVWMWHGTELGHVDTILSSGFDPRCARDGGALGKGVYFAARAELSLYYTKAAKMVRGLPIPSRTYRLLYCRVLEGNSTQGFKHLTKPPTLDGSGSGPTYDTCFGELAGSRTLCVFYDHHCFPEYVVEVKVESPSNECFLRDLLYTARRAVNVGAHFDGWNAVIFEKAVSILEKPDTEPVEVWGILAILLSAIAKGRQHPLVLRHAPSQHSLSALIQAALKGTAGFSPTVVAPAPLATPVISLPAQSPSVAPAPVAKASDSSFAFTFKKLTSYNLMGAVEIGEAKTCAVCLDDLDSKAVRLERCKGHGFHLDCLQQCHENMKKPGSNFFSCPVCSTCYGERRGDQPDNGVMREEIRSGLHLPGYEGCGTIVISYSFPGGVRNGERYPADGRVAYLPNNDKGRDVLRRLKVAFERRLIFTVGTSATTGVTNKIVWNGIHHKTSTAGGATLHGYPDPTCSYLKSTPCDAR
jgi:deltex